jgi:flagellar basal body-associated protein FliL
MPPLQPVAAPVPVAPQAVPPQTGKNKLLVPLIILGGLLLVAVVVVVFFALKG